MRVGRDGALAEYKAKQDAQANKPSFQSSSSDRRARDWRGRESPPSRTLACAGGCTRTATQRSAGKTQKSLLHQHFCQGLINGLLQRATGTHFRVLDHTKALHTSHYSESGILVSDASPDDGSSLPQLQSPGAPVSMLARRARRACGLAYPRRGSRCCTRFDKRDVRPAPLAPG